MTISIRRELTKEQYIKLFSNPVSGIACSIDGAYADINCVKQFIKNIRYSKSMILKALYFWEKQYDRYNYLLKRAQFNPLFRHDNNKENEILKLIMMVHNFPDSFLFSHRHIQDMTERMAEPYSKSMSTQLMLLNTKYPILKEECKEYGFQEQTMDIYYRIKTEIGIEFTVFPNEHPYIEKQKISKVGITEKGNVYILHPVGKKK